MKKEAHIATITLNRPHVLNALTIQMFDELKAALQDVNEDDDIRVMILTGAGKAFTTAVDTKEAGGQVGKRLFPNKSIEEIRQLVRHGP